MGTLIKVLRKRCITAAICFQTQELSIPRGLACAHIKSGSRDQRSLSTNGTDGALKPDGGTSLLKQLQSRIRIGGPITVADYMSAVLTYPSSGYYMTKDVFGSEGDFTTSPEICQIFGELLAVWCVDQWQKMGRPTTLQIVELGPGRGTMMSDILRVLRRIPGIQKSLTVHLVEISPALEAIQRDKLCKPSDDTDVKQREPRVGEAASECFESWEGFPIFWHRNLSDVPREFSILLAHEFFDALPIHKFQKTQKGWREILIDTGEAYGIDLRFVLSRNPTPASTLLIKAGETRDHLEISPQGRLLTQELANRVVEDGGVALIVDYGHEGEKSDTFRAFRKHLQVDTLDCPGTADLTADVDFSDLRSVLGENKDVLSFGPVTQGTFLENMGIKSRLERLLANCDHSAADSLKTGCAQMLDSDKMGDCFKFFAIYPEVLKTLLDRFPPSGFHPLL